MDGPFQQYRNVFRGRNRDDLRGFPFCDGDRGGAPAPAAAAAERRLNRLRPAWEEESASPGLESLVEAGVAASSTDDESQSVHQVLRNDRGFWSSGGSAGRGAAEWLLLRLRGPAARVHYVRVAVYRALYQAGHPVYPPFQLQAWLGASPLSLRPAGPWFDVLPSDALQTFPLWRGAPPARYLLLVLRGKQQLQREDGRWYTALRYAGAAGELLRAPSPALPRPPAVAPPPGVAGAWEGEGGGGGGGGAELVLHPPRRAGDAGAASPPAQRRSGSARRAGGGGGGLEGWERRVAARPAAQPFHESIEEWEYDPSLDSPPPGGRGRWEGAGGGASGSGSEDGAGGSSGDGDGGVGGAPHLFLYRQLSARARRAERAAARGRKAAAAPGGRGARRGAAGPPRPEQLMHLLLNGQVAGDQHEVEALLAEILRDPPLGLDPDALLEPDQPDHADDPDRPDHEGGPAEGGGLDEMEEDSDDDEEEEEEDGGFDGGHGGGGGAPGRGLVRRTLGLVGLLLGRRRGGGGGGGGPAEQDGGGGGGGGGGEQGGGQQESSSSGGKSGGGEPPAPAAAAAPPRRARAGGEWAVSRAGGAALLVPAAASGAPFALLLPAPSSGGGGGFDASEEADAFGEGVASDLIEAQRAAAMTHAAAA
ncbi:MAG: hypothetical protein J3K34DRAFT_519749 [Monoraphidium minutum]|nr:MAG: hypothetical protein J3K34DRAFT_519749 [Monoraphidium minutum]